MDRSVPPSSPCAEPKGHRPEAISQPARTSGRLATMRAGTKRFEGMPGRPLSGETRMLTSSSDAQRARLDRTGAARGQVRRSAPPFALSWTTVNRRSSIGEPTPSFRIRLDRLSSTARGEIPSRLAISLLGRPSLIRSRTSHSFGVSRRNPRVSGSREARRERSVSSLIALDLLEEGPAVERYPDGLHRPGLHRGRPSAHPHTP